MGEDAWGTTVSLKQLVIRCNELTKKCDTLEGRIEELGKKVALQSLNQKLDLEQKFRGLKEECESLSTRLDGKANSLSLRDKADSSDVSRCQNDIRELKKKIGNLENGKSLPWWLQILLPACGIVLGLLGFILAIAL